MQKQLINIVGALIVVLVLGLGIVLGAVPNISQAGRVHTDADQVAQTNDVYEIKVQSLRAQKKNIAELEANLAKLRSEIPALEFNDQIFELIVNAANATTSTVESAGAAEAEPWVDPADENAVDATPAPEPEPVTEDETAVPDAEAEAPVVATADESKKTVAFTIEVTSPNHAQAMAFVDALRGATRLVRIERVILTQAAPVAPGDEDAAATPPTTKVNVTLRSLVLVEN